MDEVIPFHIGGRSFSQTMEARDLLLKALSKMFSKSLQKG